MQDMLATGVPEPSRSWLEASFRTCKVFPPTISLTCAGGETPDSRSEAQVLRETSKLVTIFS